MCKKGLALSKNTAHTKNIQQQRQYTLRLISECGTGGKKGLRDQETRSI